MGDVIVFNQVKDLSPVNVAGVRPGMNDPVGIT